MIISHSRKFIFVHLHKTAGTSVKQAILPELAEEDLFIGVGPQGPIAQGPKNVLKRLNKHSPASQIADVVGPEIWDSYFKFALVRHPLDRLVSLYEFFHRVKRNNSSRPGLLQRLFFPRRSRTQFDPERAPWNWAGMQALLSTNNFSEFIRSEFLSNDQGAAPQSHSLTDQNGNLILDFIGKMESLSDAWKQICDSLGLRISLERKNQSSRRHEELHQYWNKEDLLFATQKYRTDFRLLEYSPDIFVDESKDL